MNTHNQTTRERMWLLHEKYADVETPAFFADLLRLEGGTPLAYVIGHVPFLNTTIYVDSQPLIPRPETEQWVSEAIIDIRAYLARTQKQEAHILDLCAGSGCVGVAVMEAVSMARVDFEEIDARHHPTIEKNISSNHLDHTHTHIYGGDLFMNIPPYRYDFILANPPYIDPARIERVAHNVIAHEPTNALFGGTDGIELITRILTDAPQYLLSGGVLYIEHEPEQRTAIHTLAHALPYASYKTHTDQWKRERYTRLVRA